MEPEKKTGKTIGKKEIKLLIAVSSIAAVAGGVFGVIAYYHQWLG